MAGWTPATPVAEAINALAQAMLRTGYVPAATQDEFHARVVADVLIRELRELGYEITSLGSKERSEGGKRNSAH